LAIVASTLWPGKLAAFAGLGALRHLDLHHVGVDEILRRHAEAARGHLLDRRAHRVAVRQRLEAVGSSPPSPVFDLPPMRFMAMASVVCASRRDRAEGHRAGREALDDPRRRLDLVERHGLAAVFLGVLSGTGRGWS
jgi:hypothetical protein